MVCYPQVLSSSANERYQNSNASCKEECTPRIMTISIRFTAFIFCLVCIQFPLGTQNFFSSSRRTYPPFYLFHVNQAQWNKQLTRPSKNKQANKHKYKTHKDKRILVVRIFWYLSNRELAIGISKLVYARVTSQGPELIEGRLAPKTQSYFFLFCFCLFVCFLSGFLFLFVQKQFPG